MDFPNYRKRMDEGRKDRGKKKEENSKIRNEPTITNQHCQNLTFNFSYNA